MTTTEKRRRKPANAHMKIGLVTGVIFMVISQAIFWFSVTSESYPLALFEFGFLCNLMVISSVIVLVIGVAERRFGKTVQ